MFKITGELINAIKKISVEANEATDPTRIIFGVVTKTEPLTILSEQRLTINENRLILCSNVIEKSAEETFDIYTESIRCGESSHKHKIFGKKAILLNNGLKEGEKVIMIRLQGGQNFLVLDRVVTQDASEEQ